MVNGADVHNANVGTSPACYVTQLSSSSSHGVTGIQGGEANRLLVCQWAKDSLQGDATFKHENAGSTAANRILTATNGDAQASELGGRAPHLRRRRGAVEAGVGANTSRELLYNLTFHVTLQSCSRGSEMPTVDEFLTTYVEGFLLGDVRRLATIGEETHGPGALFYPALMTICSGMELLGAIDSDRPFSKLRGRQYFERGWSLTYDRVLHLPDQVGGQYYECVRHGVAHMFFPKGKITAMGDPAAEPMHLTMAGELLILHVPRMCRDFERGYRGYFRGPDAVSREAVWQSRINELLDHLCGATLFVPPPAARSYTIGTIMTPNSVAPGGHYTSG